MTVRKLAAILVIDVVGYSRLAVADEDLTLSRLRGLKSDLVDAAIAAHHGASSSAPARDASSSSAAWRPLPRFAERMFESRKSRSAKRLQIREATSWNIMQAAATCC